MVRQPARRARHPQRGRPAARRGDDGELLPHQAAIPVQVRQGAWPPARCRSAGPRRADATEHKRRLQPSPAQMLAMLDHTDNDRDRCFIALATNTGLRAGEIVRLRVADVDLDQGLLRVVITKSGTEDLQPITLDLDRELRIWLTTYVWTCAGRCAMRTTCSGQGRCQVRLARSGGRVQGARAHSLELATRHGDDAPTARRTDRFAGSRAANQGRGRAHPQKGGSAGFFDSMVAEEGFDGALRTVSAMLHHKSSAVTELYIGLDAERRRRDERLRGRPFLTASTAMSHGQQAHAIRPRPMPQAPRPRRPQRPPGKSGAG